MIHIEQEPGSEIKVPRAALAAMAGLVLVTVIMAGTARITVAGKVVNPVTVTQEQQQPLRITFEREPGDVVAVMAVDDGRLLRRLDPGEGGFLRGVLRPLDRERVRAGADPAAPYELSRNAAGSLTLLDPLTGVIVDVAAFGRTSSDAFADLMRTAATP